MTEKSINPADKPLPAEPEIDRAALILFDGKTRERFDFTRAQAENGYPLDHGPIINPIIHRTMNAVWPGSDVTEARSVGDSIEPVGELLNPNVVKLLAGPVYDDLHELTYQAGDQMSAEVWKRCVGPLPQRTADDAPVGYSEPRKSEQLGDSAPKGSTIHITAYDGLRIVGDVAITPDGEIHDRVAWLESPDDHRKAVYAVLRELHGVTTRSPSEAHALAGATQLDEALSGSTEGISQSILSAAAEAAALEPVSEAGGEDRSVADIRKDMATAFDVLTDYWASEGMPEGVEMKLRELLADETPDPAVMSDVLFVLDLGNWQTRAVFTEDGIRLEGNSAHDLLPIIPQILESAMQYGRQAQADKRRAKAQAERTARQFETLNDAGAFIRGAIYSGDGDAIDAATALITELADWIEGNEFPHDETLTSEARDRIKAAIDADIVRERPVTMEEMHQAAAEICGKDFDHAAGDAYLRERQDQSALDRIRGEAASATAQIVDRMEGIDMGDPKGDTTAFTLRGKDALEADKAFHRAVTMGTAMLQVTHNGHADGFEVTLVTPQDSDAPDGVEGNRLEERMLAIAARLARRDGAAILSREPNGDLMALNGRAYKIKASDAPDGSLRVVKRGT